MSFSHLGVHPNIVKLLDNQHIIKPTAVQSDAIPVVLSGKDLVCSAKTGSGKTLAYVCPILGMLGGRFPKPNRHLDVLVVVPTRELAVQVQNVIHQFSQLMPTPIRTMAAYGGVSINPQMKGMMGVRLLVATPGRLIELVEAHAVNLKMLDILVLDEADKMLSLGFTEEVDKMFSLVDRNCQKLLFSATIDPKVDGLQRAHMRSPKIISIVDAVSSQELIEQFGYFVEHDRKGALLRHLIKTKYNQQVLVFASSKLKADRIADKLYKNGIKAKSIHGDKSTGQRSKVLQDFKDGVLPVLVTTDLLARGIDIAFLPCVVNYELPRSPKDFIHRIGRTGRADNPGVAISFVAKDELQHFKVILKKMNKYVEMHDSTTLLAEDQTDLFQPKRKINFINH